MNELKYMLIGGKSLAVIVDGEAKVIPAESANFRMIAVALLSEEWDEVRKLISNSKSIEDYLPREGVEIKDGKVYWNCEELDGLIVEHIQEAMASGIDAKHLIRFLEKVQQNPGTRSREQLYTFLHAVGLAITPEGNFLAYKAIRNDWKDKHSGRIDNSIGRTVSMLREDVDDDPDRTCSHGLHVGAWDYVRNYFHGGDDRVVLVEVNPADVVAVPHDYHGQKCRCCQYKVIGETTSEFEKHFVDDFSDEKFDSDMPSDEDLGLVNYDNVEDICEECGEPVDQCCCEEDIFDEED